MTTMPDPHIKCNVCQRLINLSNDKWINIYRSDMDRSLTVCSSACGCELIRGWAALPSPVVDVSGHPMDSD